MKSARILLGILVAVVLVLVAPASAYAGQLTGSKVSLSDTRPNPITSTHTFTFTMSTAGTAVEIRLQYCTTPSSTCNGPAGLDVSSAAKGTLAGDLTASNTEWTLNDSGSSVILGNTTGVALVSGNVGVVPVTTITNSAIDDCQAGGNASSDTCYVRVSVCDVAGCATTIDTTIVSYTIVDDVTVTARVDPTFTFVISAVNSGVVSNQITTSISSTYNTIPFGNLTASTPKYGAHQLNVTTNTQSGYSVTMKMLTQMAGVYSGNNIDPFATGGVAWGTPAVWEEPTGSSPNTDTGWIGANTTDTDVSGWSAGASPQQKFGPVNGTDNTVMSKSSSDNGSSAVYVTYAIEANVYQPADTYTGVIVYNALPTY